MILRPCCIWSMCLCFLTWSVPTSAQEPTSATWRYESSLLRPFWIGDVVEGESVLFIKDENTRSVRAQVLFPIQEVLQVTNSRGDIIYQQGQDYRFVAGAREIVLPDTSAIPSFTEDQLRRPSNTQKYALTHRDGNGEIYFGARLEYAEMQTCITYRRASGSWSIPRPIFDAQQLPKSIRLLQTQQTLRIVTLGDSISEGANASGMYEMPPYQPPYPELVRRGLAEQAGGRVEMHNLSVGGKDSAWGAMQVDSVVSLKPDLIILAFGMNDSAGRSAEDFQSQIRNTIEAVRKELPESEFILVSSMLGNRDWTRLNHAAFPQYRDKLKELCEPGIALADLTTMWTEILKLKKDWDQTGNGVNHPNDFGHRIYAQVILSLLLDQD
jgi:acyl-CoA thioesterase I